MLRYIYGDELPLNPRLRNSMFRDRADQFSTRLGWDVQVDRAGFERDEYDAMNPLYVIWERPDGSHGGSMRFLPTTGRCMVNDHFSDLNGGGTIESPFIWECTRFCLARDAAPHVSAALMLGGAEIGLAFYLRHAVGVFDARMVRIYGRLGWQPDVLGTRGTGREAISVGLWEYGEAVRDHLLTRAGIEADQSQAWLDAAFGPKAQEPILPMHRDAEPLRA